MGTFEENRKMPKLVQELKTWIDQQQGKCDGKHFPAYSVSGLKALQVSPIKFIRRKPHLIQMIPRLF